MMTVNEVSKRTGVSIRTLQYYDKIGLLKPSRYMYADCGEFTENIDSAGGAGAAEFVSEVIGIYCGRAKKL